MAQRFVTNLNLNQNQLINGTFEVVATDPNTNVFDGRMIFNSNEGTIKVWDATSATWRKMLTGVTVSNSSDTGSALTVSESNGYITLTPNLVTSASAGVMSASDKAKLDAATHLDSIGTLVMRDSSGRYRAATPVDGLDVANKSYVDSARTGLDVKASVKVATTVEGALSTAFAAGQVVDGYTLVAGDRILIKNQSNTEDNGIYIVQPSGAPVRAEDADTSVEVTPGLFTFVEQGTTNADSGWVLITDGNINLGVTGLEFSLFSVAGNILAGDGLSKTGDVLSVNVDGVGLEIVSDDLRIASGAAGSGLGWDAGVLSVNVAASGAVEIVADNLEVKLDPSYSGLAKSNGGLRINSNIAGDGLTYTNGVLSRNVIDLGQGSDDTTGTLPVDQGGTGATTESTARTSLAADTPALGYTPIVAPALARVTHQTVGDGSATSFAIVHNFNTRAVLVEVYDSTSYDTVIADVVRTNTNTVTVSFSVPPATNAYTVVITG